MKVPQGVEKVVALATLSAEWRTKVLADPLAAAKEAGIELGESERGVLRAISPRMLAGMIDSFGKSVPRPAGLGKLAAGAAVVALLATPTSGCWPFMGHVAKASPTDSQPENPPPPATKGIRPDIPPEKSPEPPPPPGKE